MWKPKEVIEKLISISNPNAQFFFVMPYPDTGDPSAHCASEEIGLRVDDDAVSVMMWFMAQGLRVEKVDFDDFREKEIWLRLRYEG